MFILSALLFVSVILVTFLIIRLLKVINTKEDDYIINYFKRYLHIIFVGLILMYVILTIISFINLDEFNHVYIIIIRTITELIYFVVIYQTGLKLLNNIKNDVIFDDSNVLYVQTIGKQFVYLTIVQLIAGLILAVFDFIISEPYKQFTFQTNPVIFLYLAIALILFIVSLILKKAIKIARENELTI